MQLDIEEKRSHLEEEQGGDYSQPPAYRPRSLRERLSRNAIPTIIICCAMVLLFRGMFDCHLNRDRPDLRYGQRNTEGAIAPWNTTKVQLEAHIMSKCPDARDCLQQLILPTMERISDKVDFRLSYIGSIDPHSDEVHCMHGPGECLGNIIQLCAQDVYPEPKLFLGFANCLTASYSRIPERELVEECAMEHGLDFGKLNGCISEEGKGQDLLRQSMKRSQENHVRTSCTVRLEGKVRCVRDGGEWYDCPGGSEVSDLVSEIKELYQKHNSDQ